MDMEDRWSLASYVRLCQRIHKLSLNEHELVADYIRLGNNNLHEAILNDNTNSFVKEVITINVNDSNHKGETPLHIAAKTKSIHGAYFISCLIEKGSDVNARNKWLQTPLHYAAIAESVDNIETLIQVSNIDVNAKDVNGYNALQSLIGSNTGVSPDSSLFNFDLHNAVSLFVRAGTDINSQTKYGHSILHLSAMRKDNTPLIQFLISNIARQINMGLKDRMGENFLHLYVTSEIYEEILEMFDIISKKGLTTIKALLSEKNVLGRTPWEDMIDASNVSQEGVKRILELGVSVTGSDNLGNTVLHRIAGVSVAISYRDTLETLIKAGANLHAKNVYQESAVFVLFIESVLNIFLKYNINLNATDRWGRSPLINIMKHRPTPELLKAIIEKGKADVNVKDIFKSTPLHFAAYNNFPEQIELLLNYGADIHATDQLKDTPLDTIRRHCSYRCNDLLKKIDNTGSQVVYSRNKPFVNILLDLPKTIKSSAISSPCAVQKLLGLPEDLNSLINNLIVKYLNKRPEHCTEVEEITDAITGLVRSLCTQIATYDERFEMSIFPTGSSAEGTKVGHPDEFDFVLCLDKLNDITEIVMTKACANTGFVCLKFTQYPVSEEYLTFTDKDGYFLALPFLQYFMRYLRRALNETHLWEKGKLYYTFEDKMEVIRGKPVFNFNVYWVGSVFKQLKISIDLVPVVYKKGWWPPNINVDDICLMNNEIKSAGCFLILQTKSHYFGTKRHKMKDSISLTCNNEYEDGNFIKRRMLRISAAPAEICLIKSMPDNFRHGYCLAKIVKSKEICPEIEIDEFPTKLLTRKIKFELSNSYPVPVKPLQQIKSYMLKNCTFYLFQKRKFEMKEKYLTISTLQITRNIFECLVDVAYEQQFSPYFLPYSDVFEFEKEDDKDRLSYNNCLLRLKREMCIKLVLGILNHRFPVERGESTLY